MKKAIKDKPAVEDNKEPPREKSKDIESEAEFREFLKTMNPKHLKFAALYYETFQGADSYRKVYENISYAMAARAAYNLINQKDVQKYLRWCRNRDIKQFNLSPSGMIKNLLEVFERSMQAKPVFDANGEELGQYYFYPQAAVNAILVQARIAGFLDPNKNQKNTENAYSVTTYVMPSFKSSVTIPDSKPEDLKKIIEADLKSRNRE